MSSAKQPTQQPLLTLRRCLFIGVLDLDPPIRRLDLDLIALPDILAQRLEIADKVPSGVAKLTELRGILSERVAERDTPMARGERYQPMEGTR